MFHRILVPLDGSPLAEAALAPALAVARHTQAEVWLLRVPAAERIFVPLAGTEGVLWPDQSLGVSRKEAKQYLDNLLKPGLHPELAGVPIHTAIVDGDVASVIVDTAAAEGVDLIGMSTHGRSGLTRWMLGSTAEKVLSAAPCPVLIRRGQQPLRRFLITLDGSPLAERALAPGFALAAALGEQVTLLRVLDDHGASDPAARQAAEADLWRQAQAHAVAGLEVRTEVLVGPAAETIITRLGALGADVAVMATHGRTGLRRWIYGSVTEKVLDSAHCSLLVVRPAAHDLK
ncbi:MAG: universal stress protein [Anaerolineales bacterium]|nr:universal stress protein [Anaerolineales bacterium]